MAYLSVGHGCQYGIGVWSYSERVHQCTSKLANLLGFILAYLDANPLLVWNVTSNLLLQVYEENGVDKNGY